MPNFDGTGPNGRGPLTGGGNGSCVIPFNLPEQEIDYLKNQKEFMLKQLNQINNRIKRVEKKLE